MSNGILGVKNNKVIVKGIRCTAYSFPDAGKLTTSIFSDLPSSHSLINYIRVGGGGINVTREAIEILPHD